MEQRLAVDRESDLKEALKKPPREGNKLGMQLLATFRRCWY
jgi:hypothetical protein